MAVVERKGVCDGCGKSERKYVCKGTGKVACSFECYNKVNVL